MPVSVKTSVLIILLVALTTFGTRLFPFIVFPKGRKTPEVVKYLGKVLTPGIIGLLVIYCLKDTNFMAFPFGLPALLSVIVTAGLHLWKRNMFLSIGAGTVLYMVLIRLL